MSMTRGKLIELGLISCEAVGLDPTVSRLLLNLSEEKLATEYNFKALKKLFEIPLVLGQTLYDLPDNFARIATIKAFDGYAFKMVEFLKDQEWEREESLGGRGVPDKVRLTTLVDEDSTSNIKYQLEVNREPDRSYTIYVTYYYMPVVRDVMDENTDTKKTLFPDHLILEMFKYYILDYLNSPSANAQWTKTDLLVKNYMSTQNHVTARQDSFLLSPGVYGKKGTRL